MLIIYCPLVLLCYSVTYSWEVKLSIDDQTQIKQTSEDSSDASSEAVGVETVVKSSMLPYIVQDASKSMVSESIASSPSGSVSKTNTTIRLKFGKESQDQASDGLAFRQASSNPSEYNFKDGMLNSNEHATRSHTQEMSSHKIIVYNQTKTQQQDSKVTSNNLLQQLKNLQWPVDEKTQESMHYSIREDILDGDTNTRPIIQQKVMIESDANNVQKDATRSRNDRNEQRKLIEALQILIDNQRAPSVTESTHEQSYNVSDDQVRLLHMLHKLIRNKDITYDFLNRLVLIIYMNGYRDQLLQVLFDIIIEHIEEHGNTEEQQKLIHVLIELWTMVHKLQKGNRGNSLSEHNLSSVELSREKLRVLQLLQLISELKESNMNNQKGLRSGYLDELRGLYDTSRNKDHLMKVIYDFWKKNQAMHKSISDPTWDTKLYNSEKADINELLQYILQQKELSQNEKQVLIENYKNPNSNMLSREDQLKILYDIINKNKATKEKPNGLLIDQQIYEEVETEEINPLPDTPGYNSEIWEYWKQKKPAVDTLVSEKESDTKMYQILMQLLKSTEITDKEELRVQIMEILNRMKSRKVDESNKSKPDEGNEDEPMQCKPYSTFKLDKCNKCKCNRDGIPICTFKECKMSITDIENTDVDETLSKYQALRSVICPPEKKWPVCAPGTNWRSGCHDCVCDEDGQRHCQKVESCQLLPIGEETSCQPGVIFVKECKKCKCADAGRIICIPVC